LDLLLGHRGRFVIGARLAARAMLLHLQRDVHRPWDRHDPSPLDFFVVILPGVGSTLEHQARCEGLVPKPAAYG
jgi:hypothetical protein